MLLDDWLQVKTTGYLGLWTENEIVSLCHILISNFGIGGSIEMGKIVPFEYLPTAPPGYLAFSKAFDLLVKELGKVSLKKTPFSECLLSDK